MRVSAHLSGEEKHNKAIVYRWAHKHGVSVRDMGDIVEVRDPARGRSGATVKLELYKTAEKLYREMD